MQTAVIDDADTFKLSWPATDFRALNVNVWSPGERPA
jgi:hypothetical protein